MHPKPLILSVVLALTTPAFSQPSKASSSAGVEQTPILITADLTEAPRKLYHADIDLPVKPGPATFITPEWVPGTHQATGPVANITGVVFTANGKPLYWRRDDENLYEFHVDIPKGVTTLHAHLDCIVNSRADDKIAVLEWDELMLYPANIPVRDIPIQPSVTVPAGWGIGTALTPIGAYDPNAKVGGTTHFKATNVEQLEDSPVLAGEYFHEFALAPEISPRHYIDVASDDPEDSNLRPQLLDEISNLVREAGTAYGCHHYYAYHFLLTLSYYAGGQGLEHGQSSDNGTGEKAFATQQSQLADADLLAHEFTHSWNGKYRRPYNLYQPTFATMQQGSLLWVYEGLTQYMGNVLAARSGLKSQAAYRDLLAASAAQLDYKSGRIWRPTEDTAIAASVLRSDSPAWSNWRRGQDYYQEGELFWLDADTKIRELTNDQKSLTDFLRIFLGKGGNTGPLINTYNRAELIADLNQVAPYDWATFIHDRIDLINPHADFDGITRGGYKIVYQDHPTPGMAAMLLAFNRHFSPGPYVWYSLGLRLKADGTIDDVRWGGPADKAGIAPGQKLIAVNSIVFSKDALHQAIVAAQTSKDPIHFLVQSEKYINAVNVDYHDGERYPAMVRIPGSKDYLDEITSPLAKHPAPSTTASASQSTNE
ncbi:MAG: M61 family peptidase [Acidobacteriaceae bacterium]